jgi:predicted secreted protein
VKGQQDMSFAMSASETNITTKATYPYATAQGGLISISISVNGIADLPDANGYERLFDHLKSGTAIGIQIRKDGSAGDDADAVFECSMMVSETPHEAPLDGVLTYSLKLVPNAAPTVNDLTPA